MRRKIPFKLILWLIPLVLVWLALRNLEYTGIWNVLRSLSIFKIFALAALNGLILLLMGGRWWFILRAYGYRLPLLTILGYRATSFGISYFTPGTQFGGEPYQVKMTHDRQGLPLDVALSSVSLDKLFELIFNFSFLIGGLSFLYLSGIYQDFKYSGSSYILFTLFFLPMGYFFTLWAGWNPLSKLVKKGSWGGSKFEILARSADLVISAESSISKFMRERPGFVLFLGLYSTVLWLLFIAEYWLSLAFLGANLDLGATVIALTTARLAFLMPFPGAAGALEASQVWILEALGFNPAIGISLVLLIRGRDIVVGLLGISLGSISIKRQARIGTTTQSIKITGSPDYTEI